MPSKFGLSLDPLDRKSMSMDMCREPISQHLDLGPSLQYETEVDVLRLVQPLPYIPPLHNKIDSPDSDQNPSIPQSFLESLASAWSMHLS